jgi:hypothetical protein
MKRFSPSEFLLLIGLTLGLMAAVPAAGGAPVPVPASALAALQSLEWRETWTPPAGEAAEWRAHWALDGAQGRVVPVARGFELHAGPLDAADAGHAVLWARPEFSGDLRVDFRYTRLDRTGSGRSCVNILYFHARGSGKNPYERDIFTWSDLRTVAAMRMYFEHMDAYHISFSAYSNKPDDQDYVRFRRYLPERGKGLDGTEITPTYHAPELFRTGVPHQMTLLRRGARIVLLVRDLDAGHERAFTWDVSAQPLLAGGRFGLRHMAGRAARYEDFTVRTQPVLSVSSRALAPTDREAKPTESVRATDRKP